MATLELELEQHPELTALVIAVRNGETIDIVDHGTPVVHCESPSAIARFCDQLEEMHKTFTSPPYPGNSVVDMRQESDR